MQEEYIYWLEYLAVKKKHKALELYKHNKEMFFSRYLILNDSEYLILLDKKNYKEHKFSKTKTEFLIEFPPNDEEKEEKEEFRKIFSIGNIDIVRKEVI